MCRCFFFVYYWCCIFEIILLILIRNRYERRCYNETYENKNYFWIHQPMKLTNYEGPDMNPYLFNLMFLCCVVWLSKIFRPFDKLQKKVEANIKKSMMKKLSKYFALLRKRAIFAHLLRVKALRRVG